MFEAAQQVPKRTHRSSGRVPHLAPCVVTILATLLLARPVDQLESQSLDDQRARVDALRAEWEQKRAAFHTVARALGSAEIDTIRAGQFTVLADRPIADLVNRAVPIAWDVLREALRSDSMLAAVKPIHFPSGGSRQLETFDLVIAGPWINQNAQLDDVVDRIISTVGRELRSMLDEPSRLWLGVNPMTHVAGERRGWSWAASLRQIYVELATSGSAVGRRCFAGHLSACRTALELDPVLDPVTEWYDATDLRRLIQRGVIQRGWGTAEESALCIEAGDDTACENLVRDRLEEAVLHPVSPLTHHTLVETSLRLGGDGAYGRMVRSEAATIADWIAAVADAPVDSVIARWHAEVIAARPARSPLTAATGWGAVMWILVLAATATRSTRWRK